MPGQDCMPLSFIPIYDVIKSFSLLNSLLSLDWKRDRKAWAIALKKALRKLVFVAFFCITSDFGTLKIIKPVTKYKRAFADF